MRAELPPWKEYLTKHDLHALLLVGDSFCHPDMFYLSRFLAGDPFALLAGDELVLLVSSMEKGRALTEAKVDTVETTSDYDVRGKLALTGKAEEAYASVLMELLQAHGVSSVGLLPWCPAGVYSRLVPSFDVSLVDGPFRDMREVKAPEEIRAIEEAQRHCEGAMDRAISLISRSRIEGDLLYFHDQPLTSEGVRAAVELYLLEVGLEVQETIVAGGSESSMPHHRGSGPLLAHAPIVIDIFPRSRQSRYFADMTRTVLRGEAQPEHLEMYAAVKEAQRVGLRSLRAGISGAQVHQEVSQVFLDQGYPVGEEEGFIHSTGHGVGLSVHEGPSLSEFGKELRVGNVVTVEPGLYFPTLGGIRLEDMVVVEASGARNLTNYPLEFVI